MRQWLDDGTLPQSFSVTGHSLGAFLATGLAAEFPENVAHAFLFNSPGLGGIQGSATAPILQALGVGTPVDSGKISNIKSDAGISPIAGYGVQVATPEWIAIENQYLSDVINPPASRNHALQVLTDALALYRTLGQLDSELSTKEIGRLLRAASNQNRLTLESVLDSLRMTFLGIEVVGVNPTVEGNRESFYQNLYELEETANYQLLRGNVGLEVLVDKDAKSLANAARIDFGYFLAVNNLLPFAIREAPPALWSAHQDLYDRWQSDQGKRAAGATDLDFSDSYLADRAELLGWKNRYYEKDGNVALRGNHIETHEFTDRTIKDDRTGQDLTITVVGRDSRQINNPAKVIFGGDGDETLVGGNVAAGDRLYGGGGADVLQGNQGNDYLEGGRGDDTYVWNTGDGFDTIRDSDGSGLFVVNGVTVFSGFQVAEGLYISNDEKFVLGFEGDLAGGGTLTINADFRVEDFRNGDLGILLEGSSNLSQIQPTFNTLSGTEGARSASDGNDLYVLSDTGTFFFARGGDDLSQPTPDLPGTTQVGDSGSDILFGGAGIVDSLWGGAGQDVLHGGGGRDILVGDFDRAEFYRTGEIGALDLDFDISYVTGSGLYRFRYTGTRDPGDFYAISVGGYYLNDPLGSPTAFSGGWEEALRYVLGIGTSTDMSTLYDDVLHGGAGDDLAFGGPGSDNMMGGDGDDTLHGDYGGTDPVMIVESDVAPEQAATIRALLGKPGDDYVDGGKGNDVISDVDGGHDILIGGDGADILLSEDPADSLAAFHNLLDGGEGNDSLFSVNRSLGGHDTLLGAGGDDVIEVRVGSAYVEGGSGSDTYVVRDGFSPLAPSLLPQSLVINDFDETGDGIDRLQIALWSPWSSLSITRDETNLHLGLGGNPNWITVENWFNGSGHKIEEIFFDDMTTPGVDQIKDAASIEVQFATATDAADLLWGSAADEQLAGGLGDDRLFGDAGDDILAGNEGNDTLDGGEGSDKYAFNIGDGIDRIFDSGNFGSDVIGFGPGIAPESLTLGLGSMRIRVGEGGDAIHIDGFDPANARGSGNIEYFEFADGTALHYQELLDRGFDIEGTDGDDVLRGTSVSDRVNGGPGNDTYVFGRGSGQDVISDHDPGGIDIDTLQMGPDILPAEVSVSRADDHITLALNGTGDQVAVRWQPEAGYRIERIEFADGTVWSAATLEELSAGNGATQPPVADPPASLPGDTDDPSDPQESDCRDLIFRGDHPRRGRTHRGQHGERRHLHDDADDSKRARDRVAECLAAHLAHRPRFEFEALLEEIESNGRDGSRRNAQEFERSWRAVARFAAAHAYERDDSNSRGVAIFSQHDFLASSGFGSFFSSQGLVGRALQRDANLQTLQGLEDGFRHLHRYAGMGT
ncbi:MAG TPA: calcium-binding protein [Burkholderiales bacterium]|nr:calcium-binding protein [Burkholderiales bacterium]